MAASRTTKAEVRPPVKSTGSDENRADTANGPNARFVDVDEPTGLARVARFIDDCGPKITLLEKALCARCLREHPGADRACVTVVEAAGQLQDGRSKIKTPAAIRSTISKAECGERFTTFPRYLKKGHENHDGPCLDPCELEFWVHPPTQIEREHVRRYDADVRHYREELIRKSIDTMAALRVTLELEFAATIADTERLQRKNVAFAIEARHQDVSDEHTSLRRALRDAFVSTTAYLAFERRVEALAREWDR